MKQAEDLYTTDLLGNKTSRLTQYRETLRKIEHAIIDKLDILAELQEEQADIEEQGYSFGTIHYKAGKYAYLIHPQKDGERLREYIGADPEKITAARDRITKAERRKQILHDIERIERKFYWITKYLGDAQNEAANFEPF